MLRCNAFARVVAAGAASATHNVTTRTLSLASKLAPVSGITNSIARSFATKIVKRKTTTKAKAKTAVKKKKTPTKAKPKAKKAVAKKKTPIRKRKVVKKKVVKPKKKVPTEKQKLAAVQTKARDEIKKLKETALLNTAPKLTAANAWTVFVSEKLKGSTVGVSEGMKAASAEFKALSASELEHYNHIGNQNKVANEQAYSDWVKSYTPEQIRLANNARALLKRRVAAAGPAVKRRIVGLNKIQDDRQVKRGQTGYLTFSTERRNSGDFKNIGLGESAKLITAEWKALTPAETKKYTDLQAADSARYKREYQATYGHPPASSTKKAAAA